MKKKNSDQAFATFWVISWILYFLDSKHPPLMGRMSKKILHFNVDVLIT